MDKTLKYNSESVGKEMRSVKVDDETLALRIGKDKVKVAGEFAVDGNIDNIKTTSLRSGTDLRVESENKTTISAKEQIELEPYSPSYVDIKSLGTTTMRLSNGSTGHTFNELYSLTNTSDYFKINTTTNGATTMETVDADASSASFTVNADGAISLNSGTGRDFTIDSGNDVVLDSNSGEFIMKKAGTEFSATNSAYAGMILGMTKIQNQSSTAGHNEINPDATLTVMQTAQGTDVSITFTAPPSGNVEIVMTCCVYASSKIIEFALSDNATYNEINQLYTYDAGVQSSDETDLNMATIPWVVTGLTAGNSYTYYIAAAETVSGLSAIRHGVFRTTGTHYPPIVVKAIALPNTITTGE